MDSDAIANVWYSKAYRAIKIQLNKEYLDLLGGINVRNNHKRKSLYFHPKILGFLGPFLELKLTKE